VGALRGNRAFRWLVIGRSVSLLGNAVAPIALAFAVLDISHSVTDLSFVVGARSIANIAFLLAGGVVADRLPRRLVLILTMLIAGLSQAAVATLVLTHTAQIPVLVVLSVVNGVAGAFAMPAAAALLGQVVPADDRQRANAVNSFTRSGAMIVGAAAGGTLVATVGPGWGLAVDSATFFFAALAFFLVPHQPPLKPEHSSPIADLRDGWRELVTHSWLWAVVLGFGVLNAAFTGVVQVLGPVVADATFGRKAWGFILAAETAGMVIGAIIAMRLRLKRPLFVGVACMLAELPLFSMLAEPPTTLLLIIAALAAGIGIEQFSIAWEVSMQTHVPPEKLARVYSWDMLGSFIAIPVGTILAGPASQRFGVDNAIIGAAAIMGITILLLLATPSVRALRAAGSSVPEEERVLA
jgi:MFS family permease